jgi:hypothetical protein
VRTGELWNLQNISFGLMTKRDYGARAYSARTAALWCCEYISISSLPARWCLAGRLAAGEFIGIAEQLFRLGRVTRKRDARHTLPLGLSKRLKGAADGNQNLIHHWLCSVSGDWLMQRRAPCRRWKCFWRFYFLGQPWHTRTKHSVHAAIVRWSCHKLAITKG